MDHLKQINYDMEASSCDLMVMDIPAWIVDPFVVNAADIDVTLQEQLIECYWTPKQVLNEKNIIFW